MHKDFMQTEWSTPTWKRQAMVWKRSQRKERRSLSALASNLRCSSSSAEEYIIATIRIIAYNLFISADLCKLVIIRDYCRIIHPPVDWIQLYKNRRCNAHEFLY